MTFEPASPAEHFVPCIGFLLTVFSKVLEKITPLRHHFISLWKISSLKVGKFYQIYFKGRPQVEFFIPSPILFHILFPSNSNFQYILKDFRCVLQEFKKPQSHAQWKLWRVFLWTMKKIMYVQRHSSQFYKCLFELSSNYVDEN